MSEWNVEDIKSKYEVHTENDAEIDAIITGNMKPDILQESCSDYQNEQDVVNCISKY